jgi:hypothetical protein
VNAINLLYEGVSPYVDLSSTFEKPMSRAAAEEAAADADAAYNDGLYEMRLACGEHP